MNQVIAVITKVKLDIKAFIETFVKLEDGSGYIIDDGAVFRYIADILTAAGIGAEARYQDTDWSIAIDGEKNFISNPSFDDPAEVLIRSIMYFADSVNSGKQYEAWYSYSNGEHFLNLKPKAEEKEGEAGKEGPVEEKVAV